MGDGPKDISRAGFGTSQCVAQDTSLAPPSPPGAPLRPSPESRIPAFLGPGLPGSIDDPRGNSRIVREARRLNAQRPQMLQNEMDTSPHRYEVHRHNLGLLPTEFDTSNSVFDRRARRGISVDYISREMERVADRAPSGSIYDQPPLITPVDAKPTLLSNQATTVPPTLSHVSAESPPMNPIPVDSRSGDVVSSSSKNPAEPFRLLKNVASSSSKDESFFLNKNESFDLNDNPFPGSSKDTSSMNMSMSIDGGESNSKNVISSNASSEFNRSVVRARPGPPSSCFGTVEEMGTSKEMGFNSVRSRSGSGKHTPLNSPFENSPIFTVSSPGSPRQSSSPGQQSAGFPGRSSLAARPDVGSDHDQSSSPQQSPHYVPSTPQVEGGSYGGSLAQGGTYQNKTTLIRIIGNTPANNHIHEQRMLDEARKQQNAKRRRTQ